MPRQSTHRYLQLHRELKDLWLTDPAQFSRITFKEQQVLHQYFQTTRDVSGSILIETRTQLTAYDPSLPHRAGRAFVHLERAIEQAKTAVRAKPAVRTIHLSSLANPEPDARKLAFALLMLAKRLRS